MGLLDSVRSTVSQVAARVETAVDTVTAKAADVKAAVGHAAKDSFEGVKASADITGANAQTPAARTPNTVVSSGAKRGDENFTYRLDNPAKEVKQKDGSVLLTPATGQVPPALWDHPQAILSNLPQNSNLPKSGSFCGAASALGAAVMNGPQATASFMKKVANDPASNLTPTERSQLATIAAQVEQKNVKFEDLSQAQALIYKGAKPAGAPDGMSGAELNAVSTKYLNGTGGGSMPSSKPGRADLARGLENLKPGESMVVMITDRAGSSSNDHYITIGRSPDGTPYVYNPDPDLAAGDQAMVRGEKARTEIAGYDGRVIPNAQNQMPNVTTLKP
jgi:hypothetical protein